MGSAKEDTIGCGVCTLKPRPRTTVWTGKSPGNALHGRSPLRIAMLTSRYWGPARRQLSVSFMEAASDDLRVRILSHMNAWDCGVEFAPTDGVGEVRISREPGGWW